MTFNSLMTAVLMNWTVKVLTALGVGFVSYKGLDSLLDKLIGLIKVQLGSIPNDAMQLLLLSGFGDFLNWIMSGFAFAFTLKSTTKLTARLRD